MPNQTQTQFELTQKIHQRLNELAETTGIEVVENMDFDKYFGFSKLTDNLVCISSDLAYHFAIDNNFDYYCGAIQENQIKDILVALERKLGENGKCLYNPIYTANCLRYGDFSLTFRKTPEETLEHAKSIIRAMQQPKVMALVYYDKWFRPADENGYCAKSLFQTDPIQVLSELLKVLESIK